MAGFNQFETLFDLLIYAYRILRPHMDAYNWYNKTTPANYTRYALDGLVWSGATTRFDKYGENGFLTASAHAKGSLMIPFYITQWGEFRDMNIVFHGIYI